MANALYPKFKEAILSSGTSNPIDLLNNNVKCSLIRTSAYTYSASHEFLTSCATRVADSANLGSKTTTGGTFDSADFTFSAVAAGAAIDAMILYQDTGAAGTSRLIAYFDASITGFPVTPNGGDISVTVNASGWFSM